MSHRQPALVYDGTSYDLSEIGLLIEERNQLLEERKLWLAEKDRLRDALFPDEKRDESLEDMIRIRMREIDDLKKDNLKLKAEIKSLKAEIETLKLERKSDRTEIAVLKEQVKALEAKNLALEIKDAKRQTIQDTRLIVMALQEINNSDDLEGKYPYMKDIREERHGIAHYIRTRDSADLIAYKRRLIFDQLNRARSNPDIVAALEFYDPALMSDMISYLTPESDNDGMSLKPAERSYAENWWIY